MVSLCQGREFSLLTDFMRTLILCGWSATGPSRDKNLHPQQTHDDDFVGVAFNLSDFLKVITILLKMTAQKVRLGQWKRGRITSGLYRGVLEFLAKKIFWHNKKSVLFKRAHLNFFKKILFPCE